MNAIPDFDDEHHGGSPPCFLHEVGADGAPLDPRQARDVARWRRAERQRLLALRSALAAEERARYTEAIGRRLDALISGPNEIVSVYWPIRAEPDLRTWMRAACERGVRVALPVAVELGRPLTFREWHPGSKMARGVWNIPYPADGAEVLPTTVLAPLVGFDAACYRLGYGGGFFDRTLAALAPKPVAIGVGYPQLRIATIYPQSHDIAMAWILTGDGSALRRNG